MSNYNNLKSSINNNIYENQTQQITGTVLNAILNEMTNALGAGYQFAGVATVGMTPSEPDARIFYLAGEGIYTSFDGIQVPAGKLGILKWDNRWHLETIDGLGSGGANLTGYVTVASTDDLPDEGVATLGYLCGTNLYLYVGEGGDTKEGKYQDCGSFRGPQGDSVQDVEQTQTSLENGGVNKIKFTLSNGISCEFQVRNGTTSSGLFPTLEALQAAYPSPVVGQYAFVGAGFPADIYVCTTAGTWTDSGEDYDGDNVDLTDYATKAEVNQLEAKVDNEVVGRKDEEVSSNGVEKRIDWVLKNGDTIRVKVSSIAGRIMVLRNGSYSTGDRLADTVEITGSVTITAADTWFDIPITQDVSYLKVVNNGADAATITIEQQGAIGKSAEAIEQQIEPVLEKIETKSFNGNNLWIDPNCGNLAYIQGFGTKSFNPGGGIAFNKSLPSDSQEWFTMIFDTTGFDGATLYSGHKYLVVVDIDFDTFTVGGENLSVNVLLSTSIRKASDNTYLARAYTQTFDIGERTKLTFVLSPSEDTSSFRVMMEYGTKLSLAGDGATGKLYNIAVLDITDVSQAFALSMIDKYGFLSSYNYSADFLNADFAKSSVDNIAFSFWGDSLMNGVYPQMVADHFGKEYVKNNWGGQVSSTIRDKFIERATNYPEELNNTHIFCIGRNNYTRIGDVVRDLKIMVGYLPHSRYIVMMPPNGNYDGEYKGQANYHYFIELSDALKNAFGGAFCDWRENLINMYDYGGVKLLSPFVQPEIGENVQINVSDANFLNYSNSYFPAEYVGYLRIGDMYGAMNKYQVVSVDDDTHITIKAVSADWMVAGNTIANHHYTENGADSYGYIDIILEADYQTWVGDNTPASLRSDNIHMETVKAQEFCAKLVERELDNRRLGF